MVVLTTSPVSTYHAKLPAGQARLGHFEHGAPDRPSLADERVSEIHYDDGFTPCHASSRLLSSDMLGITCQGVNRRVGVLWQRRLVQ